MFAPLIASSSVIDPKHLLESFGLLGLLAIVFAETGLLVGFFLPGDSLLVLAGLVSAVGIGSGSNHVHFNLFVVLVGVLVAAVAGAEVGYLIGYKAGPALFKRPDSRLFKQKYVDRSQHYFDKYGARTIIVARFIPVVRTFANPMAGVGRVPPRQFAIYNLIGGAAWTVLVVMLGFILGHTIPKAANHLALIEGIIILLSLTPIGFEVARHRLAARHAASPAE